MAPRPGSLWQVTVSCRVEAEEVVAALMERLFGQAPCLYTSEETRVTKLTVYGPAGLVRSSKRSTALQEGLRALRREGVAVGRGTIRVRPLPARDWAESWKRHFKPIEVGRALLIKPSWSRRRPKRGQREIILDPGLSFGTGQHATTAFCLEQIAARARRSREQSFLDMGTGSGILAIAAARLGYEPVMAIDVDPQSIRVAGENAERNGVADRIEFIRADLAAMGRKETGAHEVVAANLTADLLTSEREQILRALKKGSYLILAGMLTGQFMEVRRLYEASGLRLSRKKTEREWTSGAFQRV